MVVTHSPGNPFARIKQTRPFLSVDENYTPATPATTVPARIATPSKTPQQEVFKLEYQLKAFKDAAEREKVVTAARINELEQKLLSEGKKNDKAEADKRFLFDLQAKQAAELSSVREELAESKSTTEATISELRKSFSVLQDAKLDMEETHRTETREQAREIERIESALNNQRRAMDTLKADLTSKNDVLALRNAKIQELEDELASKAAISTGPSSEELSFLTEQLRDSNERVRKLEITCGEQTADLNHLKEVNRSLTIVAEENTTLQTKLAHMDALQESLAKAQVDLEALATERETYAQFLHDGETVADVGKALERQKLVADTLTSQLTLLENQLEETNTLVSSLQAELNTNKAGYEAAKAELTLEKRNALRLERARSMVAREVSFLRAQLASYDLEERMDQPNYDALKSKRLTELEAMLDSCRAELLQVKEETKEEEKIKLGTKRPREDETDFNHIERGEYLRKIRSLNAELEITRKQDELLRKDLDALRQSTASQRPERVLEFKGNPTTRFQAIKAQTLKDLETENAALRRQLEGKGEVTVPVQSLRNAETTAQRLEQAIAQKEKMIKRLKEVFQAKSSEFREAVYALLGYKLDFLPNGRVRLTSMYAEHNDHAFIFDGEEDTMKIAGEVQGNEAFMQMVDNLIKYWSGERKSIPGMLAALTLELLEKEAELQQQQQQQQQ
ncbi:spindle assembly checkpoint component Mad1 [Protomyces lactucae-debilis]|uniref:Spindle assembly checkpoint component MAD1 n=1 Tax=Protomyces lactucae-debilis TaxID=2754530 RepID=A0A1Y2F2Y5_PROLT|nr:spindle assembly checkpoint component Mad1 [Protomyces lactucae-debilis]ORY78241.1 spindle assembly checkpoint component Mad1 [Protomyces lactucae-debilis]